MKNFLFIFIFGLAVGIVATYAMSPIAAALHGEPTGYKVEIVLSETYDDGFFRETNLRVPIDSTGTYSQTTILLLSPDEKRVVYTIWENAHVVIYTSDSSGKDSRKIAEQETAEGSGGLNVDSISWSPDSKTITYKETGMRCTENCNTPEDFTAFTKTYKIDIQTGVKTVISEE